MRFWKEWALRKKACQHSPLGAKIWKSNCKFLKVHFFKIQNSSMQVGDRKLVQTPIDREFKTEQT